MGCCSNGGTCGCGKGTQDVTIVTVDQSMCPLCGGPNECSTEIAKKTGEPEQPCWCRDVTFTAELLATVPEEAQGVACVCRSCATA